MDSRRLLILLLAIILVVIVACLTARFKKGSNESIVGRSLRGSVRYSNIIGGHSLNKQEILGSAKGFMNQFNLPDDPKLEKLLTSEYKHRGSKSDTVFISDLGEIIGLYYDA